MQAQAQVVVEPVLEREEVAQERAAGVRALEREEGVPAPAPEAGARVPEVATE